MNPTVINLDLSEVHADDGTNHAVAAWELSADGRLTCRVTIADECTCKACMLALALVDALEALDLEVADQFVRFIDCGSA